MFTRPLAQRMSRGFTLVEMLIVMAIMALVLTLALPRYFQHIQTTRETVLRENLRTVRDTIQKFYGDTGRYPESLEELVEKRYLSAMPIDPITESTQSWIVVAPEITLKGNVYDLRSGATGTTREGRSYAEL